MVIDAIRAGRDAARSIDEKIRAEKGEPAWIPVREAIEIPFEVEEEPLERPQTPLPELDPVIRAKNFSEVELGYTETMALTEAARCLRCDAKEQKAKVIV